MSLKDRLVSNNNYYDKFLGKVGSRSINRDFSRSMDLFVQEVKPQGVVLDVGCGSGNHLEMFRERGLVAIGIDPCQAMRSICISKGLKVMDGCFEDMPLIKENVSGIWCASSLLHVPKAELGEVLKGLNLLIVEGGPLFVTVRIGTGSKWDSFDSTDSKIDRRFIQLFEEEFLIEELIEAGFKVKDLIVEDSYWGRESKWISVVLTKM